MKSNIAIIVDFFNIYESMLEDGCGGSETWVVEISRQFEQHGFNVFIFSLNPNWQDVGYFRHYVPIQQLDSTLSHIKIDFFLVSRYIFSGTLNVLGKYLNKNLYFVAHDIFITLDNATITKEMYENNQILKNHLQKIITMSEFGKEVLEYKSNGLSKDMMVSIGNGINFDFFTNDAIEKDNDFFWSSCHERGLDIFVNHILPKVQIVYPNSKIYVAQYNDYLPEDLMNNPNIVYLGRLSKKDLYKEMRKHKVCFYPNVFPETFCITILEAILCDCELVMPFRHGPRTTLRYFQSDLLPSNFYFEPGNAEDFEKQIEICSNEIIHRLNTYDSKERQILRDIKRKYILENYSWKNICDQFNNYIFHKYD